jgi:hypothetical protein
MIKFWEKSCNYQTRLHAKAAPADNIQLHSWQNVICAVHSNYISRYNAKAEPLTESCDRYSIPNKILLKDCGSWVFYVNETLCNCRFVWRKSKVIQLIGLEDRMASFVWCCLFSCHHGSIKWDKTLYPKIYLKGCILLRVSTVCEFRSSCQTQQYTKQLADISLCITEFIGRRMLQHVLDHGAIIRRYINKPYTIELCLLCGCIYCTYDCVLTINRKILEHAKG